MRGLGRNDACSAFDLLQFRIGWAFSRVNAESRLIAVDFFAGAGQNNGIPPVSAESMKTRPLAIPLI